MPKKQYPKPWSIGWDDSGPLVIPVGVMITKIENQKLQTKCTPSMTRAANRVLNILLALHSAGTEAMSVGRWDLISHGSRLWLLYGVVDPTQEQGTVEYNPSLMARPLTEAASRMAA
jgi:hypothetical protein